MTRQTSTHIIWKTSGNGRTNKLTFQCLYVVIRGIQKRKPLLGAVVAGKSPWREWDCSRALTVECELDEGGVKWGGKGHTADWVIRLGIGQEWGSLSRKCVQQSTGHSVYLWQSRRGGRMFTDAYSACTKWCQTLCYVLYKNYLLNFQNSPMRLTLLFSFNRWENRD